MEPSSLPPVLTPPKRSGLALASMILGIAGVLPCFGPLTGIPAVICGHLARSQIRKSGGQIAGSGFTITGLVTGYFSLVWILVFAVIAVAAISNSQKPQPASPARAGCVANLKTIEGAKAIWALENKKTESSVPLDSELFGPGKTIPAKPVCPQGGIYTLNAVSASPQCSVHGGLSQLGAGP